MRKTLIKIVSVITLVFGTCYQSVLALADDRDRTELSGVQLSDSKGNKLHQVKVNETNELEMTVTVNNKDGENKDGKAAMWLPEDQLKVLQEQVKAESAVTDTNATLIFERRKNNQSLVEWKNVETSATFNLKLPVQFTSTMTSMALPIALGTQHGYLQPLSVVSEDATEEEMKEAGTPTDLPADILGSLTSFINSQQAQQAQQAQEEQQKQQAQQNAEQEAPAKDENEDKDTVKEEAAKEEAEAKRDAEKKAEQEAADKDKEAAKTRDALKKNSKTADAESKTDGAKRESQDKKETRAGNDLGTLLGKNDGADRSLFNSVAIERDGKITELKADEPLDVSNLKDFRVHYNWDSDTLLDKLNGYDIKENDFYTFKIYGLAEVNETKTGDIADGGEVFATWTLVPGSDSKGAYQEVTIKFTNEKMNATKVNYHFSLEQVFENKGPIDFEYNGTSTWTVDPTETKSLLAKSGQFIGNQQIEWKITLKNEGDVKFSDIVLEDLINTKGAKHSFVEDSWNAYYSDKSEEDGNLKDNFTPKFDGNKLTLKGNGDDKVTGDITFTVRTSYDAKDDGASVNTEFWNEVSGQIGENIKLNKDEASVSTTELKKSATNYDPENGVYSWKAEIDFDLDQFGNDEQAMEAIQNMVITDTLKGAHEFGKTPALQIMIGGADVTTRFTKDPDKSDSKTLVLTPNEGTAKDLYNLLKTNNTITLTYDTEEIAGQVGTVRNNIALELEGKTSNVEIPGSGGGLVVKSGKLSRDVHDDGKAHINWTVTANVGKRTFTTLTVVDVLPEGVTHADVNNIQIKVGDVTYPVTEAMLTRGSVENSAKVPGTTLYNFSDDPDKYDLKALKFTFDSNFSGKQIDITFDTAHEWGSESHTNYVGAATDSGRYQYSEKKVTIDKPIRDGAEKSGELHLDQKNGAKGTNYVTWKVNFGSHLNHYFGSDEGLTNKVTITDTLNADGPKYLKFSDSNYKLYSLTNNGADKEEIDADKYKLTWEDNSADQRTFTIEFTEAAKGEKYTNFRLELDTPIDLEAWQKGDEDPSSIPPVHYFHNKAQVSYGDIDLDEVRAEQSVNSKGIYGQKTSKSAGTNVIGWEVIMNAYGKDIGYPEITDELSANQMHSVDPKDLELAFVTPIFTANGKDFNVEVDPEKPEFKLENGKDYTVSYDTNTTFTIKLNTKVDRPLVVRYKSIMLTQANVYTNKVKISAGSHSTEYGHRHTLEGSAFMHSWGLRFRKIDGDTKEPLPGATFQLQQKVGNGEWEDAKRMDNNKPYAPQVSNEEGYIQYHLMGTRAKYRIVEISPPENYTGSMAPLEFDKKSAEEAGWDKKVHEIENFPTLPGNLTLSKATKNLDNGRNFNFEVRAVDKQGNVNTGLQGTYKLQEVGEVTFHNGVSEEVSVPANKERTILGLPTEKVDASGNKSTQYYDVRETSTSDEYNTQVAVGNDDPIWSKQTKPFELSTNTATPVMIFFTNTAAKGDLVVSKTVSSKTEDEMDAKYDFTIQAKSKEDIDKVAGKTYEVDGAGLDELKFDSAGKATFSLKHTQKLTVMGLPEGVELTVTEEKVDMTTTWSINGGDYTSTSSPVTINPDKAQMYEFKNSTEKSGQLQITKQIAGEISADEVFKFEIKADSSVDGKYPYETYTVSNQHPGQAGMVEFKGGELTTPLTLKGDEYVKITNLPLNKEFAVKEVDPDDKDIQTTWQIGTSKEAGRDADPITLRNENDIASVTFTNKLPNGSLTLNKEVLNPLPGDQSIRFNFTIQADKDDVDKVAGKTFTVEDNRHQREDITFKDDGQITLQLRHDQTVKVLGLPAGIHLKISEEKHSDFDMIYEVVGDEDADDEDSDGPTVTVPDGKNVSVNYTNEQSTGSLILEKHAEGSYPTNKDIEFTIEALGDNKDLTGEFNATLTRANGSTTTREVNFDKGEANVSMKPGEQLEVKNLPNGDYTVTEEDQDNSVTTTWKVGNDSGDTLEAPAAVKKGGVTTVEFTNRIDDGDLLLEKRAEGNYPKDKDIGFTITALDKDGKTADFNGNYEGTLTHTDGTTVQRNVEFNEGEAKVAIKPGERLLVNNLPTGQYQVSEDEQNKDVVTTWDIGSAQGPREDENPLIADPVEVKEGDTANVRFTNNLPVGNLMLEKRAEGSYPTNKEIGFTITNVDDKEFTGEFEATLTRTNGTTAPRRVEFSEGEAEVRIYPGESLKINGLPLESFQIEEDKQDDAVTTTWNIGNEEGENAVADPVEIKENGTAHVRFTNYIASTKLELNKVVASHDETDKDKEYGFLIRAVNDTQEKVANKEYDVSGISGQSKIRFNEEGQATVSLKADQKVTISGLPEGVQLAVIEEEAHGLTPTWKVNDIGSYQEMTDTNRPEVTIDEDKTEAVQYRNVRKVGSLRVDKVVKGAYTDDHRKFEFNVAAQKIKDKDTDTEGEDTEGNEGEDTDSEDNPDEWVTNENFDGKYSLKIYDSNGLVTSTDVQFNGGIAKIELKAGQYAVIDNLPLNEKEQFQVSEVNPEIPNMSTTWVVNNGTPGEDYVADPVVLDEIDQQKVTFTNSLETGNLVLEKKLSGEITDADRNQTFEFTVALRWKTKIIRANG
ncbi:DUF7601 domain-containing protein [Secundilactobacillus yichangensis]|uniref:DUF7601 domain-containing protein n=1 Tax=Secundilactobacillus yichangensis TaxID=2799580 RepID=UPI0019421623|nr:adhesive domain-containing protein [Secundilactobacillus yichangensis]